MLLITSFTLIFPQIPIAQATPNEGGYFHNITPTRLYDSRNCQGNGNNAPLGRDGYYFNNTIRSFTPRGFVGIPSSATAIVANVTVSTRRNGDCNPSGAALGSGSVTVFPRFAEDRGAIAVNWWNNGPWQVNNHDIIGLDNDGYFSIKSRNNGDPNGGITDVIIDVFGYIDNSSSNSGLYTGITGRLYDSRPNSGYQGANSGPLIRTYANNVNIRTIQVSGNLGIPSNAIAVVLNLTASNSQKGGYFTLYPTSGTPPVVANVNWNDRTAGNIPWDIPNMGIVPLNNGQLNITVGGNDYNAGADVIIDVLGYIQPTVSNSTAEMFFYLPTPIRKFDSNGSIIGNDTRNVQITGSEVPTWAKSVIVHLNAKYVTSGGGFLAMYPTNIGWPGNSNVNTNNNGLSGQEPGNLAIIPLSPDGRLTIRNGGNSKGFVLDIIGYTASPNLAPLNQRKNILWGIHDTDPFGYIGAESTVSLNYPGNIPVSNGWIAAPTGLTPLTSYVQPIWEAGPTKNCALTNCIYFHPYASWCDATLFCDEFIDTNVVLANGGNYGYKVFYVNNTIWGSEFCDGNGCRPFRPVDLKKSTPFPFVASGAETSSQAISFGAVDTGPNIYRQGGTNNRIYWCYTGVIRETAIPDWPWISSCSGYFWGIF
jgi:hypothetical protein